MSGDAAQPAPRSRPQTQRFRRTAPGPKLTDDQQRRQSAVTVAAWKAFSDRDGAIGFLNGVDDALDARPIDLAMGSDAGLDAVLLRLEAVRGGA